MSLFSLDEYYQNATNRARRLVASRFLLDVLPVSSPDFPGRNGRNENATTLLQKWREVWKITTDAGLGIQELLIAIPHIFPDKLPQIFLTHRAKANIRTIPHLDSNRFICTFDANEITQNIDAHPGDIVCTVIEQAQKILCDGQSKENYSEFDEEFTAYWIEDCDGIALSLVTVDDAIREVVVFDVEGVENWLFADENEQATRWAEATNRKLSSRRAALYLPFETIGNPPFPKTNGELWKRLRESAPEQLGPLVTFLAKHPRPTPVLFSVRSHIRNDTQNRTNARALGAWQHPSFLHRTSGRKGKMRLHSGIIPGFRCGKEAVKHELKQLHANKPLRRMTVVRIDAERLQARTVGNPLLRLEHTVNIIGCGSLGSLTSQALARSGSVKALRFFDPQTLNYENVARHLCPVTHVGTNKALAVSTEIGKQFPHLHRQVEGRNILEVLRGSPAVLRDSSLSLIAIGELPIEQRLNRLALANPENFDHPLCFIWIEPMGLAGHAIWLPPDSSACFECALDEEKLPKCRLIKSPTELSRREAGCQTTHVLYGGVDLMAFIAALGRFLIQPPTETKSCVWSWCGDLTIANEAGILIKDDWDMKPFETRLVPLHRDLNCPVCGARS